MVSCRLVKAATSNLEARVPDELPLIYACSGCSSAAQMANAIAVTLDRTGDAEMSCIAGVGGDVPSLVRVATSGRPIVAVDGCRLACVRACLARHDVVPDLHLVLAEHDVKKQKHQDFDAGRAQELSQVLAQQLIDAWPRRPPRAAAPRESVRPHRARPAHAHVGRGGTEDRG